MNKVTTLLAQEPTAFGTLTMSVLPLLVLLGLDLDEMQIATVGIAINAVVGFIVRAFVTPARPGAVPAADPAGARS